MTNSYEDNVFINCPFDDEYRSLFQCIVFTVYRCGLSPRCALEEDDAADNRIDKIIRIIESCRYGIHDISRNELDLTTGLPRFNMPFELGIFWGAKKFGNRKQKGKIALILEKSKFQYQKYISDINGVDVKAHNNDKKTTISYIRNWLQTNLSKPLTGPHKIDADFNSFNADLPLALKDKGLEIDQLTFNDYCLFIEEWLTIKYPNGMI